MRAAKVDANQPEIVAALRKAGATVRERGMVLRDDGFWRSAENPMWRAVE